MRAELILVVTKTSVAISASTSGVRWLAGWLAARLLRWSGLLAGWLAGAEGYLREVIGQNNCRRRTRIVRSLQRLKQIELVSLFVSSIGPAEPSRSTRDHREFDYNFELHRVCTTAEPDTG